MSPSRTSNLKSKLALLNAVGNSLISISSATRVTFLPGSSVVRPAVIFLLADDSSVSGAYIRHTGKRKIRLFSGPENYRKEHRKSCHFGAT